VSEAKLIRPHPSDWRIDVVRTAGISKSMTSCLRSWRRSVSSRTTQVIFSVPVSPWCSVFQLCSIYTSYRSSGGIRVEYFCYDRSVCPTLPRHLIIGVRRDKRLRLSGNSRNASFDA